MIEQTIATINKHVVAAIKAEGWSIAETKPPENPKDDSTKLPFAVVAKNGLVIYSKNCHRACLFAGDGEGEAESLVMLGIHKKDNREDFSRDQTIQIPWADPQHLDKIVESLIQWSKGTMKPALQESDGSEG